MATWYQMNQDSGFPSPGVGMPKDVNAPHEAVIGKSSDARQTLLQSAIEGHVLAKNKEQALPLKSPKLLSVFGYDAKAPATLGVNSESISGSPPVQGNHTLWVGGGSGYNSPAYMIAPLDALQQQAYEDGTSVLWDTSSEDPDIDPTSDACLVFINAFATEGSDRPGLTHDGSDELVNNVASKCSNTIVTIHNAGIRIVSSWVDHPNVTALIFGHLPGQDTGKTVVELLYGQASPSGRLPYTVAKNAEDYGALLHPTQPEGQYRIFPQSDFIEGLFIDYRAFDEQGIDPQFEFGFGLTYTSFDYADLTIEKASQDNNAYPASAAIEEGGNPRLWDEIVTVSAEVKNSGSVDGDEVAQLYLGIPNAPSRQLRGFEKVGIQAGQSDRVEFSLTRRDLSVWDVEAQEWKMQAGDYQVYVGRSSRDLPLTGRFSI